MLNNYKHGLLKRVDQMTNEEVFDAIAGPEKRIKLVRKNTVISSLFLGVCILPVVVMDDPVSLRLVAAVYFALWWITQILWGGTIDSIMQVGERYREIIHSMQEYRDLDADGENWKYS